MLKLQSKDGKFDIVLSDATLKGVGNVKKTNVRSLSSAGRRKTKEIKGHHVLPSQKDESPRQQAKQKQIHSQDHLKSSGEMPIDPKDANKKTGKAERKPEKGPLEKQIRVTKARNTTTTVNEKQSAVSKQIKRNKTPGYSHNVEPADNVEKPGVISQSQLASIMESIKMGDVEFLDAMTKFKEKQDNASRTKVNKGSLLVPKKEKISEAVLESEGIPGLNLNFVNEENQSSFQNKNAYNSGGTLKDQGKVKPRVDSYTESTEAIQYGNRGLLHKEDSVSTISMTEVPRIGNMSEGKLEQTGATFMNNGKADRHAMRSSFVVGAPGQVAFDFNKTDKEKNKQWLADLEKQIQEKKKAPASEKERFAMAMENPSSVPVTSRQKQPIKELESVYEPEAAITREKAPLERKQAEASNQAFIGESQNERTYARGQHSTKDPFELEEVERKRQKILEHQRAVEQQVEEKRRLKMMERDRVIREEREEEEKLAREREHLTKQYEDESRKRMEKEEAERQRHMALQQSVLEAYDAAKKEKQGSILRKLKAGGHDVSKLEQSSHSEGFGLIEEESSRREKNVSRLSLPSHSMDVPCHVSSRSDKEFRPILNLMDDLCEGGKEKEKNTSKESTGSKEKAKAKSYRDETSNKKVKPEPKNSRSPQKSDRKPNSKRPALNGKGKQEQQKGDATFKDRVEKRLQKTKKESVNNRANLLKEMALKNKRTVNRVESERLVVTHEPVEEASDRVPSSWGDDNEKQLLPEFEVNDNEEDFGPYSYNRSSTVTLEENSPPLKSSQVNSNQSSQARNKDDNASWDLQCFPTERQQQILEQLQALRKGLLDKQKEYERGTTPSSGTYH